MEQPPSTRLDWRTRLKRAFLHRWWPIQYALFHKRRLLARETGEIKELRFVIARSGQAHSHIWKAWKHKSEFYITSRGFGTNIKLSFHESGVCHYAFEEGLFRSLGVDPETLPKRFVRTWQRSACDEEGISPLALIFFPGGLGQEPKPLDTTKKLRKLEPAPPGYAVAVEFHYTSFNPKDWLDSLRPAAWPMGYFHLANGCFVAALSTGIEYRWIYDYLKSAYQDPGLTNITMMDELPQPGYGVSGLTGFVIRPPDDGQPVVIHEIGNVSLEDTHDESFDLKVPRV